MPAVPLRRNRDFMLLQSGQLLSNLGTQATSIAYPLLALAITHSAAKAGVVGFAARLPPVLMALPAGVAADRFNRKTLMILADATRVVAVGTLAALLLTHHAGFVTLPIVGFVEGCGAALFSAAQPGALRSVVPTEQLPAAAGAQTGRAAAVMLAGPAFGGALFAILRALPFVVDAASYAFSTVSLLLIRKPFQSDRQVDESSVREQIREGFRFMWSQPFLRTCALLFGLANFIIPGVLLAVVIVGERRGLSGGEVGLLIAGFGACLLLGSFVTSWVRRLLSIRAVLLLELWTYLLIAAFLIWPNVYVLIGCMLPTALAIPSTDSVVHGYRIAMTPDRILGRAESARTMISLAISPLGPLSAGLLLASVSPRATIAVFFGFALVLAGWGFLSPAIRSAPSLDDLVADPE